MNALTDEQRAELWAMVRRWDCDGQGRDAIHAYVMEHVAHADLAAMSRDDLDLCSALMRGTEGVRYLSGCTGNDGVHFLQTIRTPVLGFPLPDQQDLLELIVDAEARLGTAQSRPLDKER